MRKSKHTVGTEWAAIDIGSASSVDIKSDSSTTINVVVSDTVPAASYANFTVIDGFDFAKFAVPFGHRVYVRAVPALFGVRGSTVTATNTSPEDGPAVTITEVTEGVSVAGSRALWVGVQGSLTIDITDAAGNQINGFPVEGNLIPIACAVVRVANGQKVYAIT